MTKEKIKFNSLESEISDKPMRLILHNDNVNIFDFVIKCLIEICGHTEEQAEQCTLIAHYNGQCEIKVGPFKKLISYQKELTNNNLKATIEK